MTNQLWVLAGGNGAGKSTFHRLYLQPRGLQMVNVDETARQLDPIDPDSAIYVAQRWVERKRVQLLERQESFCYETVFSHPSKIDFVADAKARGYEITLVYIHLELPELNQARVIQRVSEGGHDVPPEKIISRIPRTMKYVASALKLVNTTRLLDNSSHSKPFQAVASVNDGVISRHIRPLPDWACQILSELE